MISGSTRFVEQGEVVSITLLDPTQGTLHAVGAKQQSLKRVRPHAIITTSKFVGILRPLGAVGMWVLDMTRHVPCYYSAGMKTLEMMKLVHNGDN